MSRMDKSVWRVCSPEEAERADVEFWAGLTFEERQAILVEAIEMQRILGEEGVQLAKLTLEEGKIDTFDDLNAALHWLPNAWDRYRPGEPLPPSAIQYRELYEAQLLARRSVQDRVQ